MLDFGENRFQKVDDFDIPSGDTGHSEPGDRAQGTSGRHAEAGLSSEGVFSLSVPLD